MNIIPLLILLIAIILIGMLLKRSKGTKTRINWRIIISKYILLGTISIIPWIIGTWIFVKYQNQNIDSKVIEYTATFSIVILICSFTYLNLSYYKEKFCKAPLLNSFLLSILISALWLYISMIVISIFYLSIGGRK